MEKNNKKSDAICDPLLLLGGGSLTKMKNVNGHTYVELKCSDDDEVSRKTWPELSDKVPVIKV